MFIMWNKFESKANKGNIGLLTVLAFLIIVAIIIGVLSQSPYYKKNVVTVYGGLDVSQEPVQTACTMEDFTKFSDQYNFAFVGKADYQMVGKVTSINYLPDGDWSTLLSQYDFAMVWGKLADQEMEKYYRFSHEGRICNMTFREDCPLSSDYINDHFANNHLIHADEDVLYGLKQVRAGDIIYLEGHLVDVSVFDEIGQSFWKTSLDRTDPDCEIIYVEKVVIGEKVYGQKYL